MDLTGMLRNTPPRYSRPHHDPMLGFWNPKGAKQFINRPSKHVNRRPVDVEFILSEADKAVNEGRLDDARNLLNQL